MRDCRPGRSLGVWNRSEGFLQVWPIWRHPRNFKAALRSDATRGILRAHGSLLNFRWRYGFRGAVIAGRGNLQDKADEIVPLIRDFLDPGVARQ
jgi:hypothetical protein